MENGIVIWVDLQSSNITRDLSAEVNHLCPIYKIRGIDKVADSIRAFKPHTIFFEYDYPSAELLAPLKRLASDFPASRFVMITEPHSESLAVWALRARIWDYLIKPVDLSYLLSCASILANRDASANFGDRRSVSNEHRAERRKNQLIPALTFVKANYAEKVTLGAVSKLCGLGRYEFSRAFKQAHGTTFREFVIIHRIRKAEQMLGFAGVSITDVAFSVGFNDLSHFAQMFRRYVGVRPSDYVQGTKKGRQRR